MASEWDKVSGLGLGALERWPFPEGKTSISDYPRKRLNGFLLWGDRLQDTGWSSRKKGSYHGVLRLCISSPFTLQPPPGHEPVPLPLWKLLSGPPIPFLQACSPTVAISLLAPFAGSHQLCCLTSSPTSPPSPLLSLLAVGA